jgi:hypothetical protein
MRKSTHYSYTRLAISSLTVGAALLLLGAAQPAAADGTRCVPQVGVMESHSVTTGCTSPIGLCTAGTIRGTLNGTTEFVATDFHPVGDTSMTTLVNYEGRLIIHTNLAGDLDIGDAAALNLASGRLVDLGSVTGGTSRLATATGFLSFVGTFDLATGAGRSDFVGQLCQ